MGSANSSLSPIPYAKEICFPTVNVEEVLQKTTMSTTPVKIGPDVLNLRIWKLNLFAISSEFHKAFVAEGNRIWVYEYNHNTQLFKWNEPLHRIELRNNGADINQIKLGTANGLAMLLVVDDAGEVRVFLLNKLTERPFVYNNDNVSTWGISISSSSPYVAVSANSHQITLLKYNPSAFTQYENTSVTGHNHNIPCIDFSSCGQFLASISIDSTARVWEVATGKMRTKVSLGFQEWGWGIKWVDATSVKSIWAYPEGWKRLKQQILRYFPIPEDDEEEEEQEEEHEEEQAPNNEQQDPEIALPTELLLCSTFHHLYLYSSSFQLLATLHNAIPPPQTALPAVMVHMERLSLLEYIPELSLVVIGSQGNAAVSLIKIIRNELSQSYELVPVRRIPDNIRVSPIVGLTVTRHIHPGQIYLSYWHVFILYQSREVVCYEIREGSDNDALSVSLL